jgi:hypothetical protein
VRLLLALILMVPMLASGAARTLSDCTVSATPTASAPLDLDACTINDGDEITGILTGLASTYGNVYVRAPSRTAWVVAAYTVFTVDDFYFLEDQSARNTFLIQHKVVNPATCSGADCRGFFTLWSFSNFDNVVIGGPKLSVTLQGNHPGLGNCATHYRPAVETGWNAGSAAICDINYGFIQASMSNSTQADLFDMRANIRFSQGYALVGGINSVEGVTANSVYQMNLVGLFYATGGVTVNGAWNVWMDPDRTVFSDPFVRAWGWDGTLGTGTVAGRPLGCNDGGVNDQVRLGTPAVFDTLTGGFTIEYGYSVFIPRLVGAVGTSAAAPFVIRLKDWGMSGPGTAYDAGVFVKKTAEATFMKGDPADRPDTDDPVRFLRIIKLPSTYADGATGANFTGCTANNNLADGTSNFARLENGGSSSGRLNRGWHIEFAGDWTTTAQGGTFVRGELLRFGTSQDAYPIYNHTMRVADGTYIQDTLTLRDRTTLTGPGAYKDIAAAHAYTYTAAASLPTDGGKTRRAPGSTTQGTVIFLTTDNRLWECRELNGSTECTSWAEVPTARDSNVINTNVAGTVAISTDVKGIMVSNVNFTGSARAVITIGDNSTATVDDLCVPNGSTITGTGTLTYEGGSQSLPYTIPNGTTNCNITANDRPDPPGVN